MAFAERDNEGEGSDDGLSLAPDLLGMIAKPRGDVLSSRHLKKVRRMAQGIIDGEVIIQIEQGHVKRIGRTQLYTYTDE